MARSMQHLNGDLLCAIDTETTGLDPFFHEICQICILPLDSNIEPIKDIMPFYMEIIPEYPERINRQAMTVNRLKMAEIAQRGFPKDKVAELLEEWFEKLNLPVTNYGKGKRILPLGHNYAFDKAFIMAWLGGTMYDDLFHYHYRDTMIAAGFLDDRASFIAEKCPFGKCSLSWVANKLNVPHDRAHDALQDCLVTAQCYKKILTHADWGLV